MSTRALASETTAAGSPVRYIPGDELDERPDTGVALCLSGGGYRAMLFHLGALWRLNEVACLPRLTRISSVSGGSIIAAVLASRWGRLDFEGGLALRFHSEVVEPLRQLARRTIDVNAIVEGLLLPGPVSDYVASIYDEALFHGATLRDLPDAPCFIFNATSVQTGALWRFQKRYMADYRVGMFTRPAVPLASVVAASSAFPPVLSPARLKLTPGLFEAFERRGPLGVEPYTSEAVLTDGGVYDNLGLETAWKRCRTILVSDGGGQMAAEPAPASDWARHGLRATDIIDNQVRSLRKRQVIDSLAAGTREGAYWGIRSDIGNYAVPALPCPPQATRRLAETRTRLARLDDRLQERLINWGYAIADAAVRRWLGVPQDQVGTFPYPAAGIGDAASARGA